MKGKIGEGTYSNVFLVQWRKEPVKKFAMKVIDKSLILTDSQCVDNLLNEIFMMQKSSLC